MKQFYNRFINNNEIKILLIIWLIIQSLILICNGVNTSGEADGVLKEAHFLYKNGYLWANSQFMYLTEILLVYIINLKFGFNFIFIILIQLILNFFALIKLFNFLSFNFYKNRNLAFIACVLLLLCIPYQVYNSYIYTESIFFSLSIIYTCELLKIEYFTPKKSALLLILLLLLCITRPTGLFFFAATIIYLFFNLQSKINFYYKLIIIGLLSFFGLFILNIAMGSGGEINILLPFIKENIICQVSNVPKNTNLIICKNGNSLYGLFFYITHNFKHFFGLAIIKTKYFFGLTRNFYSFTHNTYLVIYFYPFYASILFLLLNKNVKKNICLIYFIAVIVIYWLCVIFSCDEWSNRFFLTLTPYLIIPSLILFNKKVN